MDNLLRLCSLRHRQTPIYLKRVNAHALQREQSTSALDKLHFWRIGENKNQKWMFILYVLDAMHRNVILAHRQLLF